MMGIRRGGSLGLLVLVVGGAPVAAAPRETRLTDFAHIAKEADLDGDSTWIHQEGANGEPNAILLATSVWAEGQRADGHPIAVRYEASRGRWAVYHPDHAPMNAGATFHLALARGPGAFVHRATSANTKNHSTVLDDPACNGRPSLALLVTSCRNPGGTGGVDDPHPVGVWYAAGSGRWSVFHRDGAPMPEGAAFCVVADQGSVSRTAALTAGRGAPAAHLFVTPNASPVGAGGVQVNSHVGVAYRAGAWSVVALDGTVLPSGAAWNVAVVGGGGGGPTLGDGVTPWADTAVSWDFEAGLVGWTATGQAFSNQPTLGDNVVAARVRADMTLESRGIGGDYWKRVPFPIGHRGEHWVGTAENRVEAHIPLGTVQGDRPRGTLTSAPFVLRTRYVHFLLGGGNDINRTRVELQMAGASREALAEADRPPSVGRDGLFHIVRSASGRGFEQLARVTWDLPAAWAGKICRIRILDDSEHAHVNVDDFRFTDGPPEVTPLTVGGIVLAGDPDRPVWGFADTHAHPAIDLAFGGKVVQGTLYARDARAPFGSEAYRREALPPLLESVDWGRIGSEAAALAGLLTLVGCCGAHHHPVLQALVHGVPVLDPRTGSRAAEAAKLGSRPLRSGYPELLGYPAHGMMLGQQIYGEWIHRAYEGGLRLMSALAINNWVLSAHPLKKHILGTGTPEDDRGSANVQIEDIKKWASLPENRGWVEVALSPQDARRIISANKLAIVLGLELDALGNFLPNEKWPEDNAVVMPSGEVAQRAKIVEELDRLYEQGVRQVAPIHYLSGVFGGAALFQRMFNDVNRKMLGDNYVVESGGELGIRYRLDMDSADASGVISRLVMAGDTPDLHRHESWGRTTRGHVNAMGLTRTGEILFEELARRGMLIDLDHSSHKSTDRLVELAIARDYPLLSSHTDFLELGLTGPGEFGLDDEANRRGFGTTSLSPLRNERMTKRETVEAIACLGGTCGPIAWLPKRASWGDAVSNDCDGTSKTWAQLYQYAVEAMGGHGVALSSDFIVLGPRFGPSAAELQVEEPSGLRSGEHWIGRFLQADAQRNGVRYDTPIREWHGLRFLPVTMHTSAWDRTPIRDSSQWETRAREHEDAWLAMAAWAAGRNPRVRTDHDIDLSFRAVDYAWGLWAETEEEVVEDPLRRIGVLVNTKLDSRFAAYCVKKGIRPDQLRTYSPVTGVWVQYPWMLRIWEQWHRMEGTNEPQRRHAFGTRDFDVNMDGVVHYGMLPDMLQDVANSHPRPAEVGTYLAPLFRSAEDYIRMWEKCLRPPPERAEGLLHISKFLDLDRDGRRDERPAERNDGRPDVPRAEIERPLAGWTFRVTDAAGAVVATLTTRENGTICTRLPVGTYTVSEVLQPGYEATTPTTQTVVLRDPDRFAQVIFGNRKIVAERGRLRVLTYLDVNANGRRELAEPLQGGWTLRVLDVEGALVATQVSEATRSISIDLPVGRYTVEALPRAEVAMTTPGRGTANVLHRRDADLELASQPFPRVCIMKFLDQNGNGEREPSEPLLHGWTFDVIDAQGGIVATLTIHERGTRCVSLPAGRYTVRETPQPGYTATTATSQEVTLVAGQPDVYLYFGNRRAAPEVRPGHLCAFEFLDLDGDGRQGPKEQALVDWGFHVLDAKGIVVAKGTTGVKGFCVDLPAGTYDVVQHPQPGYEATTPTTQKATVTPGQVSNLFFGQRSAAKAKGTGELCVSAFYDNDGDGQHDKGEPLLPGWTVEVYDASGAVVATLTSGDPKASCTSLPAGDYTLVQGAQPSYAATASPKQMATVHPGQVTTAWFGGRKP